MKSRWTLLLISGLATAILSGCGASQEAQEAANKASEAATMAGNAASKAGEAAAAAGQAAEKVAGQGLAKFEATIKDAMTRIPNLDMTKITIKTEGNTLKVTGNAGTPEIRAMIDERLMKLSNPLFKIDTTGLLPAAQPAPKKP